MASEQAPPQYKAYWFRVWVTKKEDEWASLTKEEIQELLYTAFLYVRGETIPDIEDRTVNALWSVYKRELDKDIKRYHASVENGKKGGRPKKEIDPFNTA